MSFQNRLSFGVLVYLLLLIPLMSSGKNLYALLLLELSGFLLLGVLLWRPQYHGAINRWVHYLLWTLVLLPLLYLIPLPLEWWQTLPGRDVLTESVTWLQAHSDQNLWLTMSFVPQKTVHACLALVPFIAVFMAVVSQDDRQIYQLIYLLIAVAVFQACLGLIQYSNPSFEWAFLGIENGATRGASKGSYLNRDHFSALMHMTLPVAMGLLAFSIGNQWIKEKRVQWILLLIVAVMVLLLAGVFSRSRAGGALIVLGILLSSIAFARHIGGRKSAGLAASISALGFGIALSIGLVPVLSRFLMKNPAEDLRWELFSTSMKVIREFSPFGAGPGTFQEVYRLMQPTTQIPFINHAHNDYLELIVEMGLLGVFIIACGLLLYLGAWWSLRKQRWGKMRFIKVAAGLGILMMLLHALVDFNFHTPANALVFTLLAGVFFRKADTKS